MRTASFVRVIGFSLLLAVTGCGDREPPSAGAPPDIRLLTESQYRNAIADLFGAGVVVGGRFDPLIRTGGLLAVGARGARITPAGFEQYDARARAIARQVFSGANRTFLSPCAGDDEACARQFVAAMGRMLFRRPLSQEEVQSWIDVATVAGSALDGPLPGYEAALTGMLVSPEFLFIIDRTEDDPTRPGTLRLDGYAKATRLSFFLWNTTPDDRLLAAADAGLLHSAAGLASEIDRMVDSPRVASGVRAFFTDMLRLDEFSSLEKDAVIYPLFSLKAAEDAREQVLRTITALLLEEGGDYRDLFTTRQTFISGPLGRLTRVPVPRPDGGWTRFEFPPDDPRAGILTQIAFTALHAHAGRSSPTLRGRAVRESLLCQQVPDPPGDVDFSLFSDPNSPNKTARQRLDAHGTSAACAGCHKLTDPIGLGMEQFDGVGQFRTEENGVAIDTRGDLDGTPFGDAAGLAQALHDHPALTACLVNQVYSYAVGRTPRADERQSLDFFERQFVAAGHRFPGLLRSIASSEAFFAIAGADVTSSSSSDR